LVIFSRIRAIKVSIDKIPKECYACSISLERTIGNRLTTKYKIDCIGRAIHIGPSEINSIEVGNIDMGIKFPYLVETALDSWFEESLNFPLANG